MNTKKLAATSSKENLNAPERNNERGSESVAYTTFIFRRFYHLKNYITSLNQNKLLISSINIQPYEAIRRSPIPKVS